MTILIKSLSVLLRNYLISAEYIIICRLTHGFNEMIFSVVLRSQLHVNDDDCSSVRYFQSNNFLFAASFWQLIMLNLYALNVYINIYCTLFMTRRSKGKCFIKI